MSIGVPIGWLSPTRQEGDRVSVGLCIGIGSPVPVPDTRYRFLARFGLVGVQDLHLPRHLSNGPLRATAGAGR